MRTHFVDLRSDAQARAGDLYYPGYATCGNCGVSVVVWVPKGEQLQKAVQRWRCNRCGLVGPETPSGHEALVNPGPTPDEMPMPEEEDAEPWDGEIVA